MTVTDRKKYEFEFKIDGAEMTDADAEGLLHIIKHELIKRFATGKISCRAAPVDGGYVFRTKAE